MIFPSLGQRTSTDLLMLDDRIAAAGRPTHPRYYVEQLTVLEASPWSPAPGSPLPPVPPTPLLVFWSPVSGNCFLSWCWAVSQAWPQHCGFTLCPPAHNLVSRSEPSHLCVTDERGGGSALLAKFRHRASTSAVCPPTPEPPAGNDPCLPMAGVLALPSTPECLVSPVEPSSAFCPSAPVTPPPPPSSIHSGYCGASSQTRWLFSRQVHPIFCSPEITCCSGMHIML